jgi:predicted acyl esterase
MKLVLFFTWVLPLASGLMLAAEPRQQSEMVPMRDGIRLATDVYLPSGTGPWPVILARTPYNKDMGAGIGADGAKRGYAVVVQDCRGRFASEGENLPFHLDHRDGPDTMRWIVGQSWCNGRIGTWGGSAGAITQLLLTGRDGPQPVCEHLTVGAPDLYDAMYPGGVFKAAMIEGWIRGTRFASNALAVWEGHPANDAYWQERSLSSRYAKAETAAVHIGGWYDIFAQGTLDSFVGYQTRGGPAARGRQKLVMGPWTHGVLQNRAGDLKFPDNAKRPPGDIHDAWKWFDWQLKGQTNGFETAPAVTYYVMGDVTDPKAPGNVWRTADRWPPVPTRPTPWFLRGDRTLKATGPGLQAPSLTYSCNPTNPVPTLGGRELTLPAGGVDQRKIEARPDVLVFTSAPLDEPLEVTGRVRVKLWASSDAPDTDYIVRLCDVYPDGRSINVCDGQRRARFRTSFAKETRLEPGKFHPFEIDLWSTSIIFNRGHSLRVHVTSSSAPGLDPNPNTGAAFRAPGPPQTAHNTIGVDRHHPSQIVLPVATPAPKSP